MTPKERATKLIEYWIYSQPDEDMMHVAIENQIQAAVEEQKGRCAIDHAVNTEKAKAEAFEEAIQWVRARARDCGCSEWIEDNIRARVKELKGEEV